MDVKSRLTQLMDEFHLERKDLQQRTGLPLSTINTWFGKRSINPSIDSLELVCKGMGITLAEFFMTPEEKAEFISQQNKRLRKMVELLNAPSSQELMHELLSLSSGNTSAADDSSEE